MGQKDQQRELTGNTEMRALGPAETVEEFVYVGKDTTVGHSVGLELKHAFKLQEAPTATSAQKKIMARGAVVKLEIFERPRLL